MAAVNPARAAALAAVLVTIATGAAPPVLADPVAPGPVDSSALPPATAPRPTRPTRQRQMCAVSPPAEASDADPLAALDLPALWRFSRGAGQKVAVIDTGVARHRRLRALVPGGDFVSTGDGAQDCDGHGTVVAGIIAAATDPGDGFSGVAPDASVIAIRQTSVKFGPADTPGEVGVGDVDTLAAAVRAAADQGATVINISTVACGVGPVADGALGAALAYAVDVKDAVVVTAAGNTGGLGQCPAQVPTGVRLSWDTVTVAVSPAWYDDYVLTVASAAADGTPSVFTMPGPWVDVAAPGEGLTSLNLDGNTLADSVAGVGADAPISGTSYAAPVVAGVAALLRARYPELTARQVMARIESTAGGSGWTPALGAGLIDPLAALAPETVAAPPSQTTAQPIPVTPGAVAAPDGRFVALLGTAVCALALAAMWGLNRWRAGPRPIG